MSSHVALKTVWILTSWLLQKPADLDPHCLQAWFHSVFESVNCLSMERYKLICSILYYQASKIYFGQVHYGHLLVPGQVENFTISTPLQTSIQFRFCCLSWQPTVHWSYSLSYLGGPKSLPSIFDLTKVW